MTSKISFSKAVRNELHQLNWMTAIWALLFGMLIPFRVLLVMAVNDSQEYQAATAFEVFCGQVGLGRVENTVFILGAGAMCALCAFAYLHSSVKLDLYHSLALRRERLFAVKYTSSVLTFVIAYLVCQVLAVLIGIFYGIMTPRLMFEMGMASVQGILHFLCSYSATLVALMLTGKMLTTIFAVGVMGLYIPFVYVLGMATSAVFFETGLVSGYWDLTGDAVLKCSSPWAFCVFQPLQGDTVGLTGYVRTAGELCQLLALAALLTALVLLLYRVRRTEAAGSALAFRKTEGIVKLLLTVPTALAAALFANELFDSIIWEFVFIVLFGALTCMIMEFIYRWDIRQVLHQKRYIAVTVVLAGILFFGMRFDVTGYNTYLPSKEDVVSMSLYDGHFQIRYPEITGSNSYSSESGKKLLDYFETEDFESIYTLAENGVEHVRNEYGGYGDGGVYVAVKYRTKNGKESYRNYCVEEELYLNTMEELMQREEFREKYFPILGWDDSYIRSLSANAHVYTSDIGWGKDAKASEENGMTELAEDDVNTEEWEEADSSETIYIDIPARDMKEVVEAYRSDLAQMTWRDIWECRWSGNALEIRRGQVSWDTDNYPLSGKFENTLKVLKGIWAEEY